MFRIVIQGHLENSLKKSRDSRVPHPSRYPCLHQNSLEIDFILNFFTRTVLNICLENVPQKHDHQLASQSCIPYRNKSAQLSVRTDYDNSFRVRAAQLFNVLPPELRGIIVLDSFIVSKLVLADLWNSTQTHHRFRATLRQTITQC